MVPTIHNVGQPIAGRPTCVQYTTVASFCLCVNGVRQNIIYVQQTACFCPSSVCPSLLKNTLLDEGVCQVVADVLIRAISSTFGRVPKCFVTLAPSSS